MLLISLSGWPPMTWRNFKCQRTCSIRISVFRRTLPSSCLFSPGWICRKIVVVIFIMVINAVIWMIALIVRTSLAVLILMSACPLHVRFHFIFLFLVKCRKISFHWPLENAEVTTASCNEVCVRSQEQHPCDWTAMSPPLEIMRLESYAEIASIITQWSNQNKPRVQYFNESTFSIKCIITFN